MESVAHALLLAGATLILIASIGVMRFPDIFSRMHAAAKAPTLAILLMAVGTALAVRTPEAVVMSFLVATLQLVAGPVGAHMLARSVYLVERPSLDGPDELADAEDAAGVSSDAPDQSA